MSHFKISFILLAHPLKPFMLIEQSTRLKIYIYHFLYVSEFAPVDTLAVNQL